MSQLTILLILSLAPLAMGVCAVIAAALFVFVAVIAREEYTARGMAKRAPQPTAMDRVMASPLPKAYEPKRNEAALRRVWEAAHADMFDTLAVEVAAGRSEPTMAEALERDAALAQGNRVFSVDTDGICSVMSEARAFAEADTHHVYTHAHDVYISTLADEQAKWPNIDTTDKGQPLHAKRILAN
jgi:hypothetical protein